MRSLKQFLPRFVFRIATLAKLARSIPLIDVVRLKSTEHGNRSSRTILFRICSHGRTLFCSSHTTDFHTLVSALVGGYHLPPHVPCLRKPSSTTSGATWDTPSSTSLSATRRR